MRSSLPVGKIERIVHGARRMIRRNIERLEIMKIILDFRTGGDLKSRLHEDPLDSQARASHRVQAARLLAAARQSHIDGARGKLGAQRLPLQAFAARLQGLVNRGLRFVDLLSGGRPLGGRQLAQAFELLREQALLAEKPYSHFFQSARYRETHPHRRALARRVRKDFPEWPLTMPQGPCGSWPRTANSTESSNVSSPRGSP